MLGPSLALPPYGFSVTKFMMRTLFRAVLVLCNDEHVHQIGILLHDIGQILLFHV